MIHVVVRRNILDSSFEVAVAANMFRQNTKFEKRSPD